MFWAMQAFEISELKRRVSTRIEELRMFAKEHNYSGFDPYDIREHPIVHRLVETPKSDFEKFWGSWLWRFIYHFPLFSRAVFRVRPKINPKGMGLFAYAYCRMFEITKEEEYLRDAEKCLEWLESNFSRGYAGYAWGYPFNWQTRIFVPRETPSGVVTTTVGNAFLKYFELTGDEACLNICKSISLFLLNDLYVDEIDESKICFSYTPLDRFHIHNANLFVAEFLLSLHKHSPEPIFLNYARRAIEYTLSDQQSDGSFEYWGPPDRISSQIDLYHTGFVLRSLESIYRLTGYENVKGALIRGYEYFLENFFTGEGQPRLKPNLDFPVDIHAVAEAILCLATIETPGDKPRRFDLLKKVFNFAEKYMRSKKGYYFYHKQKYRTIKIPYIRWGQAWMIRALVEFLAFLGNLKEEGHYNLCR